MALNFPNNPGIGSVYTDSTSGFSYQWNGTLWQSYSSATAANIQVLDDISGSFNGSTLTFALTSGGTAVSPVNAQQLDINLGGVIQAPGTDYTISGSNITFTGPAPTSGLTFSGKLLGTALSLNTVPDGVVTPPKLSTGGPSWNSGGDLNVTGILTASTLNVTGNVSIAGTLTYEDVTNVDSIGVITARSGIDILSGGISAVGVITATSFSGDGSGLTGVGVGIQSAGSPVGYGITQLNFAGVGNTFAVNGTTATITISGSGGSGVSSTGIATAAIFSNPSFITTSFTLNEGNNNYGAFGPISVAIGATITVGAGNTFVVV